MSYPIQNERVFVNPSGNVAASGYYRSSLTQETANMMPPWMQMRQNQLSVGQQFLSTPAEKMKRLENNLNREFANKFLQTAYINEPDVLYRVKIPGNLDLLDTTKDPITCLVAPSGCSPSGVSSIQLKEINELGAFYYDVLPTRVEVESSGAYNTTIDGFLWNVKPSGILDKEESYVDVWNTKHDISWAYADGKFRKQDVETMEDYETYSISGSGTPVDMWYNRGILWWIGHAGAEYFLNLSSTKTKIPTACVLDLLVVVDITSGFSGHEPSGIIIDKADGVWVCDTEKKRLFEVYPRYDYFITDKQNGYIYFREDYRDSGVFISNN